MDSVIILLAVFAVVVGYRLFIRTRAKRYLMSSPGTVEISSSAELDALFSLTNHETSILFLHDPWCPISGAAAREVAELDRVIHLIDVSRSHELSRSVATRTGVRHESPQLFVIAGGRHLWNASHDDIQAEVIRQFLATVVPPGVPALTAD